MRYRPFLPALLCLIGITLLSIFPNPQLPQFKLIATDKLLHALAYGVQTGLLLYGARLFYQQTVSTWVRGGAMLGSSVYGVLMEWVQYALVPGRFYEYDDMLANVVGALVVTLVYPRK